MKIGNLKIEEAIEWRFWYYQNDAKFILIVIGKILFVIYKRRPGTINKRGDE